ncbi:Ca-transporting ATPase [Paraphysoderma sedebokerense]|nr:Ca-transporting ATPase [Paraphysoderma sedebokerense]
MDDAFVKTTDQVLTHFKVSEKHGLTEKQVKANRDRYGPNELPEDPPTPLWKLILAQFSDQLVIILLIAAFVSFVLAVLELEETQHSADGSESLITAFVEPIVILLILIANATVGVIQESNAEKAIEALKQYSPDEAKVLRDGQLLRIPAVEIVPGDIIHVAVGDKVPADARLLSLISSTIRIDQSPLTGESVSVHKDPSPIDDARAVNQDMTNILFSGTTVTIGKAIAVVVKTGEKTEMGKVVKSVSETETQQTPLKRKLDEFGDWLAKLISVVCILVWVINIRHFNDPAHHGWVKGAIYYFKIAVALAVAAIPEGLAVVITTCLALGTKRMAKKNAIVRSLPSVETLGCTSIICSDKTGTLTTNRMCVNRAVMVSSSSGELLELSVSGNNYSPHGDVTVTSSKSDIPAFSLPQSHPGITDLCHIFSQCNDAQITYSSESEQFVNVGEPTEAALKVLVEKLGCEDLEFCSKLGKLGHLERAMAVNNWIDSRYERLATFEFSRDRKSMSVLVRDTWQSQANPAPVGTPGRVTRSQAKGANYGKYSLFVKGAPESILERCTRVRLASGEEVKMTPKLRQSILNKFTSYAITSALRVLACATLEVSASAVSSFDGSDPKKYVTYEQDLCFVGLAAMMDPPREEVKASVEKCRTAGIRVVVITGDNKNTAEAICRSIGVFTPDEDITHKSFTGREWDDMSLQMKKQVVKTASLFSRVEPQHKSELVDLLQGHGEIVAMTGDGVNDAPALRKADIGIAMGTGTDVAKLAADMVLADDNFASIVAAVEEGRSIYNNTKQFIRYLISSNIGEVVSIFLTVILGMPEALIPVQLLWVNLVTDGLPATALGFNPPDNNIMRQPPRSSTEPIVGRWLLIRYVIIGTYVGIATVFGYAWWFMYFEGGPGITFHQLSNFHKCATLFPSLDCTMFTGLPSRRATTVSLSVLVVIEMFNAMNSLSENESLLTLPLWKNFYLCFAIVLSMLLHFMILYVPFFATLFQIVPLTYEEWRGVVLISIPVIFIDETLKFVSRTWIGLY